MSGINNQLNEACIKLNELSDKLELYQSDIELKAQYQSLKEEVDDLRELLDHEETGEIVCPYCGKVFTDSWEVDSREEDLGEIECMTCWNTFKAERNIAISYSTDIINKDKRTTYNVDN